MNPIAIELILATRSGKERLRAPYESLGLVGVKELVSCLKQSQFETLPLFQ